MGEHWGPKLPGTLGRPSCLVWYHWHPRALAVLGPSGGYISEEKGVICHLISVVGTQSILESSRGRVDPPSRTGILLQHRGAPASAWTLPQTGSFSFARQPPGSRATWSPLFPDAHPLFCQPLLFTKGKPSEGRAWAVFVSAPT